MNEPEKVLDVQIYKGCSEFIDRARYRKTLRQISKSEALC